jgi:hypothetical protein
MFARFAEFRLVWSRRIGPGSRAAVIHCNDNLPGFCRRADAGKRRPPMPVLTCRWFNRGDRLECRWQDEADSAPTGAFDGSRATGRSRGRSSMLPRGRSLALAG